jgi:hypothetical protein
VVPYVFHRPDEDSIALLSMVDLMFAYESTLSVNSIDEPRGFVTTNLCPCTSAVSTSPQVAMRFL